MSLKVFLIPDSIFCLIAGMLLLGIISCSPRGIKPSPESTRVPIPDQTQPEKPLPDQPPPVQEPKPRMTASLALTTQARSLIANGRADRAIRILERAVSLNPSNGENYYYLSEAWLLKKNAAQADNFNELASMHLEDNEAWQQRITDQKQRIKLLTNDEDNKF